MENNIYQKIGNNVKNKFTDSGFNMTSFSEKMGIKRQQFTKYINGQSKFRVGDLFKAANILECNVLEFFKGIDPDHDELIELSQNIASMPPNARRLMISSAKEFAEK